MARATIAIAFRRAIERRRRSNRWVVRERWLALIGIVLRYGVLRLAIGPVPACCAALDDLRKQASIRPVVVNKAVERREHFTRLDPSMSAPPSLDIEGLDSIRDVAAARGGEVEDFPWLGGKLHFRARGT